MTTQPSRPWALRVRHQSIRGNWQRWRTHATYTTEAAAEAAGAKFVNSWIDCGYQCDAYVRRTGAKTDPREQ